MNDFYKSNKFTDVIWLKTLIDQIVIKVRVKPREGIVTFPKHNEYLKTSELHKQNTNEITEHTFKWQEKVFSRWEINQYSDINKCLLKNEIEYNTLISNSDYKVSSIFTRIETLPDKKVNVPNVINRNNCDNIVNMLCFSKLNIKEKLSLSSDKRSSLRNLYKREESVNDIFDDQQIVMHVLWDNSEYNIDSELLYKDECILVSIYHDITNNCLMVSPNVNDIENNPYNIVAEGGPLDYDYSVQIDYEDEDEGELIILLNKLNMRLDKKQKSTINFALPPAGASTVLVLLELVSATGWDADDLYIQYDVKVPESIKYEGERGGRTHVSRASRIDDQRVWRFGHAVELVLEHGGDDDSASVVIYLEAISCDWWGRRRTEGYARLPVTLVPGSHGTSVACVRPEELDRCEAESRRFFVGGCHLIEDLSVLDRPHDYDTNFRYVTSGNIVIRWNIMRQGHTVAKSPPPRISSTTQVLQGADDVLQQYQKAKASLAAATEDLDFVYGSGDG